MTAQTIAEWLEVTYSQSTVCPPPEAFLIDEWAALSDRRRDRIEKHIQECAACAASGELAVAFDKPAAFTESEDAAWVVRQLEQTAAPAETRLLAPPEKTARSARSSSTWRFAVAAMVVLGVALAWQVNRAVPPALPQLPADSVVRGIHLDLLSPLGELEAVPETFSWQEHPQAVRYRIRVLSVDDSTLAEFESEETTRRIPEELRERIRAAVRYSWYVEALDQDGRVAGRSPKSRFRVGIKR